MKFKFELPVMNLDNVTIEINPTTDIFPLAFFKTLKISVLRVTQ